MSNDMSLLSTCATCSATSVDALGRLDAAQQVRHAHLPGGVADVVAAAGCLSGDGPASAQNHHATHFRQRGIGHDLSTSKNWLKIQVLDI
jgi:hypothetical protein